MHRYRRGINAIRENVGLVQIGLCFILLFVLPILPQGLEDLLYKIFFLLLLFVSSAMIERHNKKYFIISVLLAILRISANFFALEWIRSLSDMLTVIFFIVIPIVLVKQILVKKPGALLIVEAISAYLLLGISLSILMLEIINLHPGSFSYQNMPLYYNKNLFELSSYFVFISYTTVGYGDILPLTDVARTFAKFVSTIGQIYLSVIMAILIGKYFQFSQEDNE